MSTAEEPNGAPVITQLLNQASAGDRGAFRQLLPLVYDEMKHLARSKLRLERTGHTLNATALVHEAYMKLVDLERVEWQSRSHFFAIASQAMRRILIDYAKARKADKRGGGAAHVPLDEADEGSPALFSESQAIDLLAIDSALERLAEFNPRGAEVVQYRFFGGLRHQEIADVLGVSEMTVRRSWMVAKTWLRRELSDRASAAFDIEDGD